MADTVKISGLPSATSTTGADYVPIVQGGITKKAPLNVLGSGAGISKVSDEGLQAYWNMDAIPEIPDDPAGVTYLQDTWATVDGWTGSNATIAVAGGELIMTATTSNAGMTKAVNFAANKTFRLRIKAGGSYGSRTLTFGNGSDVTSIAFNASQTYVLVDVLSIYAFTTVLALRVANSVAGEIYNIDWIYIGTGAYLPNSLIDNSGNGRGATVKGSTPVAGTSGKALSRDQLNDYEVTDAVQTMPDIFWYHEIWTIPNHATQLQALVGIGTASAPWLLMYRAANTRALVLSYWDGSANQSLTITDMFPATTLPVVADIIVNWLTGVILVYKDGAYFAAVNMTAAVKPSPALWYFGNQSALSATQFAGGIVDERRVYNVTPSADEVHSLFVNKGRGPDCQVKSVAPLKDSLVVRDPLGNIQANGLKFPGTQVASIDPNTLDDYEEGVFTPGISFGGASVGITYSLQVGRYTKIGRLVTFHARVTLSAKGSSTGSLAITGLPFVSENIAGSRQALGVYVSAVLYVGMIISAINENTSQASMASQTEAGGFAALTQSNCVDTSSIAVSGHYYV